MYWCFKKIIENVLCTAANWNKYYFSYIFVFKNFRFFFIFKFQTTLQEILTIIFQSDSIHLVENVVPTGLEGVTHSGYTLVGTLSIP